MSNAIDRVKQSIIRHDPLEDVPKLVVENFPDYSYLNLDSNDRLPDQPVQNFLLSKKGGGIYQMNNVEKIALYYVQLDNGDSPNINPRNNRILVQTADMVIHSGTIATGWYTSEDLVTALNAMFAAMTPPLAPVVITVSLSSDIDGRRLIFTSNAPITPIKVPDLKRDLFQIMGLNLLEYGTAIMSFTRNLLLYYTRYYEIQSKTLTQYNRLNDQASTNFSSNVIIRIYTRTGFGSDNVFYPVPAMSTQLGWSRPDTFSFNLINLKWLSWNNQSNSFTNTIDFTVLDEFGDLAYTTNPTTGDFNFSLIFLMRTIK